MKKVILTALLLWGNVLAISQTIYNIPNQQKWVDSVYNSLNKNERLGQFFLSISEGNLPSKNIKELIKNNKLGGIYFSKTPPASQVSIGNIYQKKAKTPLLISLNTNDGFSDIFQYPNNQTLKAVKNSSLITELNRHRQQQFAILGSNILLTPTKTNITPSWNEELLYQLGANQLYISADSIQSFYMIGSNNITLAIKKFKKAIRKNSELKIQIEANVKQILKAKYIVCSVVDATNPDNLSLKLKQPKFEVLIEEIYKDAISMSTNNLLPFNIIDTTTFASISLNGNATIANGYLSKYAYFTHYNESENLHSLLSKLASYKVVVANIFHPSQLTTEQLLFLKQLATKTSLVVCYYGEIYEDYESFKNKVEAHENTTYTQKLVPQILFGALKKNDVSLNRLGYGLAESVGMDSYILNKIDRIAHEAIAMGATPGCQILIARKGKVIFNKNYGFYTYDSLRPIASETLYDLASITKVAATLQTVMFMVEKGLIDLDYKLSFYLPELKGTNKENMIIRDILAHQAGLWPWIPFWKSTMENDTHLPAFYSFHPQDNYPFNVAKGLYSSEDMEDKVWQWVIESDLREKNDKKPYGYKYSDMGYYMLYHLAESILNQPIEDFLSQNVYEPLGASTLNYLPLCNFPEDLIAPTENDTEFRKSQLLGTVHDQGAAMIGGVAGHAGLFSNANDLAKLFQMHLQNGSYGGNTYFTPQTLDKFRHPQYASNRRGAGWDKPIPGAWYGPTGENVSPNTYGHTGFTGTAAWVDPEFNLVYIFLSNRVYPDASNAKLYRTNIRTRIQDLIYEAIWSYCNKND